jgi:hypothetical protein
MEASLTGLTNHVKLVARELRAMMAKPASIYTPSSDCRTSPRGALISI